MITCVIDRRQVAPRKPSSRGDAQDCDTLKSVTCFLQIQFNSGFPLPRWAAICCRRIAARYCRRWRALSRQSEHMSVTSVFSGHPAPYGPVSGNNPQSAKLAVLPKQSQPATRADGSQVTSARISGSTRDGTVLEDRQSTVEAGYAGPTDVSQFEQAFAQTLRPDGTTRATPKSGTAESGGSQRSAGIALYQRINQIGNEPSTSELLRKWNSIMQGGHDAGDAGAATLRALFQNEEPASGSRILDVTA